MRPIVRPEGGGRMGVRGREGRGGGREEGERERAREGGHSLTRSHGGTQDTEQG